MAELLPNKIEDEQMKFLLKISQPLMKELWDNKEDEIWGDFDNYS